MSSSNPDWRTWESEIPDSAPIAYLGSGRFSFVYQPRLAGNFDLSVMYGNTMVGNVVESCSASAACPAVSLSDVDAAEVCVAADGCTYTAPVAPQDAVAGSVEILEACSAQTATQTNQTACSAVDLGGNSTESQVACEAAASACVYTAAQGAVAAQAAVAEVLVACTAVASPVCSAVDLSTGVTTSRLACLSAAACAYSPAVSPFAVYIAPAAISPAKTVITTKGVVQGVAVAGKQIKFSITTTDEFGNAQVTGGATVGVTFEGNAVTNVSSADNEDGTYEGVVSAVTVGSYLANVTVNGFGLFSQYIQIAPAPAYAPNCVVEGDGLATSTCGTSTSFTVISRDMYQNEVTSGVLTAVSSLVKVAEPRTGQFVGTQVSARDADTGVVTVRYTGMYSGTYSLKVSISTGSEFLDVAGSPFAVQLQAGPLHLERTAATARVNMQQSTAPIDTTAGLQVSMGLAPSDQFGNAVPLSAVEGAFRFSVIQPGNVPANGLISLDDFEKWSASTTIQTSGVCTLDIIFQGSNGNEVSIMSCPATSAPGCALQPFIITVRPGASDGAQSAITEPAAGTLSVTAGAMGTITLQAKDTYGNIVVQGGLGATLQANATRQVADGSTLVLAADEVTVVDKGTGEYSVMFSSTAANGGYGPAYVQISIGETAVSTAVVVTVTPAAVAIEGELSSWMEALVSATTAGASEQLTIYARDKYGNLPSGSAIESAAADVAIRVTALVGAAIITANVSTISAGSSGSLMASYTPTKAGSYQIHVLYNNQHVRGSPAPVAVTAEAAVSAAHTVLRGAGMYGGLIGQLLEFQVILRDQFQNPITSAITSQVTLSMLDSANGIVADEPATSIGLSDPVATASFGSFQSTETVAMYRVSYYYGTQQAEGAAPLSADLGAQGLKFATVSINGVALPTFTVQIESGVGEISPPSCMILAPATTVVAGEPANFTVEARDNKLLTVPKTAQAAAFSADIVNGSEALVSFDPGSGGSGIYIATFSSVHAAAHTVRTYHDGTLVGDLLVVVIPASPHAESCYATGDGLLSSVAGDTATFSVHLFDAYGNQLAMVDSDVSLIPALHHVDIATCADATGALVNISALGAAAVNATEEEICTGADHSYTSASSMPVSPQPNCMFSTENAVYVCTVYGDSITLARECQLSVELSSHHGGGPIPGGPWAHVVVPAQLDGERTLVSGAGLTNAVAGGMASFELTTRDRFGNYLSAGGSSGAFTVQLTGELTDEEGTQIQPEADWSAGSISEWDQPASMVDTDDGRYTVSYKAAVATGAQASYTLRVLVVNGPASTSTFLSQLISVVPDVPSASKSTLANLVPSGLKAGSTTSFDLNIADQFGNKITDAAIIQSTTSISILPSSCNAAAGVCYEAAVTTSAVGSSSNVLPVSYASMRSGVFDINVTFAGVVSKLAEVTWIKADAPQLKRAVVMTNGQGIRLFFNTLTDRNGTVGMFSCDNVLGPQTTSSLGGGAFCMWESSSILKAMFGSANGGTTMLPIESTITVAAGSLAVAGVDSHTVDCADCVALEAPCSGETDCVLEEMLLSISYANIGECDDLVLDASNSKDPGLGTPSFSFSFVPDVPAINALLATATASTVTVPSAMMASGAQSFVVRMENSYGQIKTQTGSFVKASAPVPTIKISGASQQTRDYTKDNFLIGDAILSECPGASTALTFSWSAVCPECYCNGSLFAFPDTPRTEPYPAGFQMHPATSAQRKLYLPANTMQPPSADFDGAYKFCLKGFDASNSSIFGEAAVVAQTLSSDVKAVIKGGDRVASQLTNPFVLDGSDTIDPDDPDQTGSQFVYKWYCATVGGASCYNDNSIGPLEVDASGMYQNQLGGGTFAANGHLVNIPNGSLKLSTTREERLVFTLVVSKDPGNPTQGTPRTHVTQAIVTMISGQVPDVTIQGRSEPIAKPENSLYVIGTALPSPDNGNLTYIWKEEPLANGGAGIQLGDLCDVPGACSMGYYGSPTMPEGAASLALSPKTLAPGSYVFTLDVTEVTTATILQASASQKVYVNGAPSLGTARILPETGVYMSTTYVATFEGWLDDQSDPSKPLMYSVTALLVINGTATKVPLAVATSSNKPSFFLPIVGNITMEADVTDFYGSTTTTTLVIQNTEAPYSDDAALTHLQLAQGTGDPAAMAQVISAKAAGGSNSTDGRRRAQDDASVLVSSTLALSTSISGAVLTSADARSEVELYLSALNTLAAQSGTVGSPIPAETLSLMLSSYGTVSDAARVIGMTKEMAASTISVAYGFTSVAAATACALGQQTSSRAILLGSLKLVNIGHGLLLGSLAGEAPKVTSSHTLPDVDTALTKHVSVVGLRASPNDGVTFTYAGSDTLTMLNADVAKVLTGLSKYFDFVQSTYGVDRFCSSDNLAANVNQYSFFDPASSTPLAALAVSYPATITIGVLGDRVGPADYLTCKFWSNGEWKKGTIDTGSYDGSAVSCNLPYIYSSQLMTVVASPWSICSEVQYESVAPTAISDRQCQLLTVCDSSTEYELVAPNATSNRVCASLTVCDANAVVLVNSTATSDRTCECESGYWGDDGTVCTAWTACSGGAEFMTTVPNATTDRACLALSTCNSTIEYEAVAPQVDADRICLALAVCNFTTQYELAFPTPLSNR